MLQRKCIIAIPCLLRGGTEMQTLLLARVLLASGYAVEVICYFENDESVVAEFKAIVTSVTLLQWSRSIGAMQFISDFAKIIRAKKPDFIHIQYMAPGLLPIIAAKFARVPVVLATVHYPGTPHGLMAHLLLRFGAFLTDCFTCVSQAAEKSWFDDSRVVEPHHPERYAGRKHFTIPNAVDIEEIDKALAEKTSNMSETASRVVGKTVIGTVARLYSEKGVDVLLKAFALVQKAAPNMHLLIVGDGVQKDYLQKQAAELGIADSCTWMGRLPRNEAMGCLNLMDVVVVPSRFEGFGLTAIEAMACGKPVVASRVDGLAEIIQDGVNGFLVSSEDVDGFSVHIVELAKDEGKRKSIGAAARKCVEEKYAYPIFRAHIRALYSKF